MDVDNNILISTHEVFDEAIDLFVEAKTDSEDSEPAYLAVRIDVIENTIGTNANSDEKIQYLNMPPVFDTIPQPFYIEVFIQKAPITPAAEA